MRRTTTALIASLAALTMVLAACGSDDSSDTDTGTATDTDTGDADADAGDADTGDADAGDTDDADAGDIASGGIVYVNGTEPQNPLIPADTNEVGGGRIINLMFAGLVYYDGDGATVNEMATDFSSEDGKTWTITIDPDWQFTNGEPVTAASYVDAWKDGAYRLNSYFFENIDGWDGDNEAELTGLEVVDDTTFTVTLKNAQPDYPETLGYSAYYPLPQAFFDDPETVGQSPIGNGPYKLASDDAWQHDVQIDLVPNPDYQAGRKAQNGGVTIIFYDTQDSAYNDLLAGQLDVLDAIPDSAFGTYQDELGDRWVSQPAGIFQSFTIPVTFEHFKMDDEGRLRRAALSHAIDRQTITDVIFQGTRTPARDFTSPVMAGWSDDIPGNDVLDFDPDLARDMWAQADEINPWSGEFRLAYNADGGHDAWVEATTNSIRDVLGIDAEGESYPDFAQLRTDVTNRDIDSAFRTGWQGDYPSMSNFLGPLYATGAGSNDGDYSNPEFDKLIREGDSIVVDDPEGAYAKYKEAQTILFKDLPAIPLWYSTATGGWSENVDNVVFGWDSVPLYYQITKS